MSLERKNAQPQLRAESLHLPSPHPKVKGIYKKEENQMEREEYSIQGKAKYG
jgi:hypothetical protein